MDGLEHRGRIALRVDVRGRRDAERASQCRRQVGQDVRMQVGGDGGVPGRYGADYPRPCPGRGGRRRGLWIARSDWNWGTLDRLDPATGAPQRRYEIAPGTEGIAFGNAGRLWAVSEAGSRHIYAYPFLGLFQPFFPLVFALDLSRLE
jgi:hypothetical protein